MDKGVTRKVEENRESRVFKKTREEEHLKNTSVFNSANVSERPRPGVLEVVHLRTQESLVILSGFLQGHRNLRIWVQGGWKLIDCSDSDLAPLANNETSRSVLDQGALQGSLQSPIHMPEIHQSL